MRLGKNSSFVLLAIPVLVLLATAANAETIADANLFSGAPAVASSHIPDYYPASGVTDGLCASTDHGDPDWYSLVWDLGDNNQRVAITNFNAVNGIDTIRIWARPSHRTPAYLAVWSSTSANAGLNSSDLGWNQSTGIADHFETALIPMTSLPVSKFAGHVGVDPTNPSHSYADFAVNAPAGTKSIMLAFGEGYYNDSGVWDSGVYGGAMTAEIQGFRAVPEPTTMVLLGNALVGLICYAWRKRK